MLTGFSVTAYSFPVLAWLWTSPEHLREGQIGGSAPGDVYSFGIILQEVITEMVPYGNAALEPTGILYSLLYRYCSVLICCTRKSDINQNGVNRIE